MAVKKPKAPPFIVAKNIVDYLKKGIDYYEEYYEKGSEVVKTIYN